MKMSILALLVCFLGTAYAGEQSAGLPAPGFSVARLLNAPLKKINGPEDLKGKVVYVEFWATWCAPCVASIPHMNRLQEALKGEPVVFLSVTDEPADTVEKFIKTHEMKAWLGLDAAGSSLKAFKVVGRPDGYLIGRDGKLLARIFPAHLEERDLRNALAGEFAPRPIDWPESKPAKKLASEGKALFEIKISTGAGKMRMRSSSNDLTVESCPLNFVLAHLWDMEMRQVMMEIPPVSGVNLYLKTEPETYAQGLEVLQSAIQSVFGFHAAVEKSTADVYELRLVTGAGAPRPKPGAPEVELALMTYGDGRLLGTAEMPRIARALWSALDRPVIDKTGLKGGYEFDLQWPESDRKALDKLLAEQGLILVPASGTVEYLRVSPAKQ